MIAGRSKVVEAIRADKAFDVIVIGGGVNGIGVYRDLSLQGLRVLLVEKNDFCSGCSSAPSRMIHGGLRYLENGEFDLVRESLRERDALLTNAPHMVRPLPTVIPIASVFSGLLNSAGSFVGLKGKPAERGLLPIKLGLALYDWIARKHRILPAHTLAGRRQTRRRWPFLTKEARFTATYYDAWISHPERLCLELLRDTEAAAPGSLALNYATLRVEAGQHLLRDSSMDQEIPVKPKVIVNASGAWLDEVSDRLQTGARERMVSGTKGSHLILDNRALFDALDGHMVYYENSDGRVCVVFPYLGRVLAGSTDIRVDRADRVKCEPEERDYIVQSLNLVFDGIEISAEDIVFSYSGIRPLPQSDADFTGRISRGHAVRRIDGEVPQFCMIGGKWTTFRAFGEQAADGVLAELGKERSVSTLTLPIGGGRDYPKDRSILEARLVAEFGITSKRAHHLVDHYGTSAFEVYGACAKDTDDAPLSDETEYSAAEIAYLVRCECALTVADVILRRTSLAIRGKLSGQIVDRVTEVVARTLDLSADEAATQRRAVVDELTTFHGMDASSLNRAN